MAKASTKHFNQRKIPLPSFPLGLDWSQNPESIPDGALVQAENCEYNHATGALRTCPGVTIKLDHGAIVQTLYYDETNSIYLFNSGQDLYKTDFTTKTLIGTLTGTSKPVYCQFNGKTLIASGGHLQQWDGTILTTISASPNCIFVMEREARAAVFGNTNRWDLSGIRDATNWTENTDMDAIFIEVGDNSPIIAVDDTSGDLIFYKTNGTHRLKGIYPDWDLVAGPKTAHCMNYRSAKSVGNASFFVGYGGFMKLSATDTYSDIDPTEEGLNINAWVAQNIDNNAEIWHVQNKKQLWIKTQNDKGVYLYHYIPRYPDGRGAFTHRTFVNQLSDVCTVGDKVYIAYGNKIGMLDATTDKDDGQQITMAIRSKRYMAERIVLVVKYLKMELQNIIAGTGSIQLLDEPLSLTFNSTDGEIFIDEDDIYSDDTDIALDEYTPIEEYGLGSKEYMQIQIYTQSGAFELRGINIDMV